MLHKFGHHSELNKLGLIICEHPWRTGRGDRFKFLAELVSGFLQQSGIPKILILRLCRYIGLVRHLTTTTLGT